MQARHGARDVDKMRYEPPRRRNAYAAFAADDMPLLPFAAAMPLPDDIADSCHYDDIDMPRFDAPRLRLLLLRATCYAIYDDTPLTATLSAAIAAFVEGVYYYIATAAASLLPCYALRCRHYAAAAAATMLLRFFFHTLIDIVIIDIAFIAISIATNKFATRLLRYISYYQHQHNAHKALRLMFRCHAARLRRAFDACR